MKRFLYQAVLVSIGVVVGAQFIQLSTNVNPELDFERPASAYSHPQVQVSTLSVTPKAAQPAAVASPLAAASPEPLAISGTVSGGILYDGVFANIANLLASMNAYLASASQSQSFPQNIAGNGNPEAIGAGAAIDQLSNVTITNPTITGLSASAIPDLSSSYLSLGGGTLTGAFTDSGTATSSFAGALGIGTTSPGSLFAIAGVANWTTATSTFYATGGVNLAAGCFAINGTCIGGSGGGGSGTVGSGTQGQFAFYSAAGTALSATSTLLLSQAGNVGIGTSSPDQLFAVNGYIDIAGRYGYMQGDQVVLNASSTLQTVLVGQGAGLSLQSGSTENTLVGFDAGQDLSTSTNNSFFGYDAGILETSNGGSSLFGSGAGYQATAHALNAFGENAGGAVTTAVDMVAFGNSALNNLDGTSVATGFDDTALGIHSEGHMGAGYYDTAVGNYSMVGCGYFVGQTGSYCVLNGGDNTGVGQSSLGWIGGNDSDNTGIGFEAGLGSFGANENTFVGSRAGVASSTGNDNIAIGYNISTPSISSSNTLNIGNLLYGFGMTSNGPSAPAGNIGVATSTPWGRLSVTGSNTSASTPGFLVADSNNNPLFAVMDNGFVGIGTTSPATPLDIAAQNPGMTLENTKTSGCTNSILFQFDDTGGPYVGSITSSWAGAGITFTSPRDNVLGTNGFHFDSQSGAERLTINTGTGNIGIGTTSPDSRLEVWGPDTATTSAFAVVNSASTTEFTIYDTGNATLAGSLVQNSDERLKTNIESLDASSSLSLIDALNPVSFTWIDPNKDTVPQLGFIAQQVLPIFPNLVSTTSPTALTPNGTLSLNYINLVSPIVSAIQALSAEITSIENAIAGFAQSFTTHQLCLSDAGGAQTCISQTQLATLLASTNRSNAGSASAPPSSATSDAADTPPMIQINGDNPAIVDVGANYADLGATITGPQADLNLGITTFLNGQLVSNIVLDTSAVATETIDYVVTDQDGLTSTSTRTVNIEQSAAASSTAATSSPPSTAQ